MDRKLIQNTLCKTFCSSISVHPVPTGFAVSSVFTDRSGDRIDFYLTNTEGGFRLEDDGHYLANLVALGISVDQGQRSQLLEAILAQSNAYWDQDTYEVKSKIFEEADAGRRMIDFLSALIRIRDLESLTRDVVRSTFREDAISALKEKYDKSAKFEENTAVDKRFSDFPCDLIIRPVDGAQAKVGALFFVTSNDKLNEALLLKYEKETQSRDDFQIFAMLEDPEMSVIRKKNFQRAQNRGLAMPIFRGDEEGAVGRIGHDLKLAA